jgi:hypothetical protein
MTIGFAFALLGHGVAPAAGDLVAHAGEAELEIIGVGVLDAPALGRFAGQAARGRDHPVVGPARDVDDATTCA